MVHSERPQQHRKSILTTIFQGLQVLDNMRGKNIQLAANKNAGGCNVVVVAKLIEIQSRI